VHKLTRPIPPACLCRYDYRTQKWGDVSEGHKGEIWLKIDDMQGKRCAYCEAQIVTTKVGSTAHIEHFEQRKPTASPDKTFLWSNLFGSCNRQSSCGKYKDDQSYTQTVLIKPDIEDPEDFLLFAPDGTVSPRIGLTPMNKHRAMETIRIFNLNASLVEIRKRELKGYIQTAEFLAELFELAAEFEDGLGSYEIELANELAAIQGLPFETAIRHTLCR
jgi:uncharacterized protein (TIGR02646 family)